MRIVLSKKEYAELEKAFGKKDMSKMHIEIVTDKNGFKKRFGS